MRDLLALAYVSTCVRRLSDPELEALLLEARERNHALQVTGVLLYDDGNFFQYIEGPPDSVRSVYERIRASSKHRGLIELCRRKVSGRSFSAWDMGFSKVPGSRLLELAQASWEEVVATQAAQPAAGPGITLLREFWSQASRRAR